MAAFNSNRPYHSNEFVDKGIELSFAIQSNEAPVGCAGKDCCHTSSGARVYFTQIVKCDTRLKDMRNKSACVCGELLVICPLSSSAGMPQNRPILTNMTSSTLQQRLVSKPFHAFSTDQRPPHIASFTTWLLWLSFRERSA